MALSIRKGLTLRGKSLAWLARELKTTSQNFNNKMQRDNFCEKELNQIAEILGCEFNAYFVTKDDNNTI